MAIASNSDIATSLAARRQSNFAREEDRWIDDDGEHASRATLQRIDQALGWFSIGLGLVQIAAPRQLSRWIGADNSMNPALVRLCGAREIVSGVGLLSGRAPGPAAAARVAGDTMDLALLGAAMRSPGADVGRLMAATAAVLGVTALDIYATQRHMQLDDMSFDTEVEPSTLSASVGIKATPDKLYSLWRNLENLPRFMQHLDSVETLDAQRSHWIARTGAGAKIEWDARITQDSPNSLLSWETVPGSVYAHRGTVRFESLGNDRGTKVSVEWTHDTPRGRLAAGVAKLAGDNPEVRIVQDLRAFKQWVETGEIASTHGQSTGVRSVLGKMASRREQ